MTSDIIESAKSLVVETVVKAKIGEALSCESAEVYSVATDVVELLTKVPSKALVD